jgi:hypothetical protein
MLLDVPALNTASLPPGRTMVTVYTLLAPAATTGCRFGIDGLLLQQLLLIR